MTFPLSKYELDLLDDLKKKMERDENKLFSKEECQKWRDFLNLMIEREIIWIKETRDGSYYGLKGDYSIFERWIFEENNKAKKISKRKLINAIIVAISGAGAGSVVTIIIQRFLGLK